MSKVQAASNIIRAAIRSQLPPPNFHKLPQITNLTQDAVDKADKNWPVSPDIAFICSHGRTSNRWMGRILNLNPDILCGVGPIIRPRTEHKPDLDMLPPDEPNHLGNVIEFQSLSVDEMLSSLKDFAPGFPFYVRAHAINAYQLMYKILKHPPACKVGVVNVIRHPVPRAPSYAAEWLNTGGKQLHLRLEETWRTGRHYRIYEDAIRARFPEVDFSNRQDRYFLMGMFWLYNDLRDFTLPVRHFRYEELVSHIDLLCSFLKYLLGRDFIVTPDYLARIQAEPAANKRRVAKSAVEVYHEWQPWQKYCFRRFMDDYDIEAAYRSFGYDFSFID